MGFLVVMALASTMAVPVVGALLVFSLLIGLPAAGRCFADRPSRALGLSVVVALATVWVSIAVSYLSNLPVGFLVGRLGALDYGVGRGWMGWRRRRPSPV